MWHSLYSTGVKEFDHDHEQIDAMLGDISSASTAAEEHRHLMQLYCAIISHIRFKNEFLGAKLSHEQKEHDANFLRSVRENIRQRDRGQITRKELISELRHLLMVHAAHHKQQDGSSST